MSTKAKNIALWVLAGLLAAAFAVAGTTKLLGAPEMVANFHRLGYSDGFRLFIGAAELAGAVGLLLPPLRFLASLGLVPIMIGAVATHVRAGEGPQAVPAAILLLLLTLYAWARRPRAVLPATAVR
jgi:uncharacterized membrane protein YphA (DoxX/SURF4 family)